MSQFIYFLREVCLLFNFWMIKLTIISKKSIWHFHHSKIEKYTHFPQKIYKLRQTKLSQFVYFSLVLREREETRTKYSAPYPKYNLWKSCDETTYLKHKFWTQGYHASFIDANFTFSYQLDETYIKLHELCTHIEGIKPNPFYYPLKQGK